MLIVAVNCSSVGFENSNHAGTVTVSLGRTVTVQCISGYSFDETDHELNNVEITCTNDGTFYPASQDIGTCQRKSTMNGLFHQMHIACAESFANLMFKYLLNKYKLRKMAHPQGQWT